MFLERFPRELRDQIYGHLLVNSELAKERNRDLLNLDLNTWEYLPGKSSNSKYYLTWGLLYTCKQVYAEASDLLYNHNTFLIECCDETRFFSPLARNSPTELSDGRRGEERDDSALDSIPALQRIKHLRIVIRCPRLGPKPWTKMCSILHYSPPRSLNIFMPREFTDELMSYLKERKLVWKRIFSTGNGYKTSPLDMIHLLEPLRGLRNIQEFDIEEGGIFEDKVLTDDLKSELTALVKGNSPRRT